jgi:diguanylate cyclase (GGDEF)-like protein
MSKDDALFDARIAALLDDPAHAGHPLREALAELYARHAEQLRQIERIAYIADRYQGAERERRLTSTARFQRQLRQIEKVMRISDRYQHMLRDANEKLQWLSHRDELTGLPNRRHMQSQLLRELAQLDEQGGQLCVALADLDHFKAINDNYGHDVGDMVLTALAQCLEEHVREQDLCGRWGGEEFLLIFPRTELAGAQALLERLHQAVAELSGQLQPQGTPLSVSFGLTCCVDGGEAPDRILKRVDRALYQAKQQGRKRTVVSP